MLTLFNCNIYLFHFSWSFGVLLYETFTFNAIPYSSVPLTDIKRHLDWWKSSAKTAICKRWNVRTLSVYHIVTFFLRYKVMRDCWHFIPDLRLSFDDLYEVIGNLLLETAPNYGYIEVEDEN